MWNIHDRWAIFISGRGSNLQALLDLSEGPRIALVVSSSPKALGLVKAKRAGVRTLVLDSKIDWESLHRRFQSERINKIFLLGFMKIIPEQFVALWSKKILNIHPSLLPQFVGLHALEKSYESKADIGVTVHEVIADLDAGPHVLQRKVLRGNELNHVDFKDCAMRVSFCEHQMVRESFLKWGGSCVAKAK